LGGGAGGGVGGGGGGGQNRLGRPEDRAVEHREHLC